MKTLLLLLKNKLICCISLLLLSPIFLFGQPTEEDILASIDLGVEWMVSQQNPDDGSWGDWERVAHTGFALTKLCDYAYEHNYNSPFHPDYEYHQNVIDGFDFLFSHAKTYGDGLGIYILEGDDPHHETYNTAIALMAFAATYSPETVINYPSNTVLDNVPSFVVLVDEIVNYFEWSQNDNDPLDDYYGSWGYHQNYGWGDNSHTGYVVLGLRYAEAFGTEIPQGIKDKLTFWIDYIQNDDMAHPDNLFGGSGYNLPDEWVTSLKTANLLFEMAFCGDDQEDERVQNALGFLAAHWDDLSSGLGNLPDGQPIAEYDYGWQEHLQAMFCLMKGFESFSLDFIEVGGVDRNWFEEFTTYIVGVQQDDGRWLADQGTYWGWTELLNTYWALFVLEKVTSQPAEVEFVDFDIHPTSWPNPINVNANGLTPTAILGTADFDVSDIDVTSLKLEGLSPFKWSFEDVTRPAGTDWECNDTEDGPDGFDDLTLKFKTRELAAALGEVNDGDEMILTIIGRLIDDGQIIKGNDCIIIINNEETKSTEIISSDTPVDFNLTQNYPNPVQSITSIHFSLPTDSYVIMKLYNYMGKEIETIVSKKYAAGYYSVYLDASNLASGVYFYKCFTDGDTGTKRMLVIDQ